MMDGCFLLRCFRFLVKRHGKPDPISKIVLVARAIRADENKAFHRPASEVLRPASLF